MTEKDLYAQLKRALPHVDFQRIETTTQSGIPDVSYCFPDGTEGWIELKIGVPRLKPSQVAWHTRAYANHRRAFILTDYYSGTFELHRANKFHPVDKHFTPALGFLLISTNKLIDISSYLTRTY